MKDILMVLDQVIRIMWHLQRKVHYLLSLVLP